MCNVHSNNCYVEFPFALTLTSPSLRPSFLPSSIWIFLISSDFGVEVGTFTPAPPSLPSGKVNRRLRRQLRMQRTPRDARKAQPRPATRVPQDQSKIKRRSNTQTEKNTNKYTKYQTGYRIQRANTQNVPWSVPDPPYLPRYPAGLPDLSWTSEILQL